MKKIIFSLLIFTMVVVCVSCNTPSFAASESPTQIHSRKVMGFFEAEPLPIIEVELVEETPPVEQDCFSDDIPLTYDEQDLLKKACEEFKIPYALALGLIEKETEFRNIIGDGGASTGYMQVQQKWHQNRMDRLGVTDLSEPYGNFRVGLDYLSELYGKYNDWNLALTVYNRGHYPGFITDYAKDVMKNYSRWQELAESYN